MVSLTILSGRTAGTERVVDRFPFTVGRSPEDDLRLKDAGIWDRHLTFDYDRAEGVLVAPNPKASATVNLESVEHRRLKSGDVIEMGVVKIQFRLSATTQRGLRAWEWAVWALIAAATALQVFLLVRMA